MQWQNFQFCYYYYDHARVLKFLEWIYFCFEFPFAAYCCCSVWYFQWTCTVFVSIIILNTLFLLRQIIWVYTKFFQWFRMGFSYVWNKIFISENHRKDHTSKNGEEQWWWHECLSFACTYKPTASYFFAWLMNMHEKHKFSHKFTKERVFK